MQAFAGILGLTAAAAMMASPLAAVADSIPSDDATAEQIYQRFRQQHPSQVDSCFPDLDLVEGPGALSPQPEASGPGWQRAVVALDASGSMAGRAGSEVKMTAAVDAVKRFMDSLPDDAEVGLVVFGHEGTNDDGGKAESCAGVEALVPVSRRAAGAIGEALDTLEPTGWTPLAAAIETAGAVLAPVAEEGEQVVFIVSDGDETCGGDPAAAARQLHASGARAVINVIGFDLPAQDRAKLAEVARIGGGVYLDAASSDEMLAALQRRDAWIGARFEHTVAAVRAQTTNGTSAFVANSAASECVADIQNTEYALVSDWVHELRAEGVDPEAFMGFREMVMSDHRKNRERLEAYRSGIDAQADEARRAIEDTIIPPAAPPPGAHE